MKKRHAVAGIGELLWDLLPTGKQPGGAPFNFACHARQAGCDAFVVSAVGRDEAGTEILGRVKNMNIPLDHIQVNNFPTGTVSVDIDQQGHPRFTIHEDVAWDHLAWDDRLNKLAGELDAVCFGSLAQRNRASAQTIQAFVSGLKPACLKVFDTNLRQHYYSMETITQSLAWADFLKLNEDELPVIAGYHALSGDLESQLRQLMNIYQLKLLAYTTGGEGSMLMGENHCSVIKAPRVQVADTVGAGDSFTAVMVAGILKNMPLDVLHNKATEVAAFVCTQKGATPILPKDVIYPFIETRS